MELFLEITILCLLLIIILQDMKERAINWILIPLLFSAFTFKGLASLHSQQLLYFSLFNISFTILQLLLLTIYFSIKEGKLINIINTQLGVGDILFFFALSTAFSPINFILFHVTSLLFTLIIFLLVFLFNSNIDQNIPLAGGVAFSLIILHVSLKLFPKIDLYIDILP